MFKKALSRLYFYCRYFASLFVTGVLYLLAVVAMFCVARVVNIAGTYTSIYLKRMKLLPEVQPGSTLVKAESKLILVNQFR
jgi:hypothetical protein